MPETLQNEIDRKLRLPRFRRGGPIDFESPVTPENTRIALGNFAANVAGLPE